MGIIPIVDISDVYVRYALYMDRKGSTHSEW